MNSTMNSTKIPLDRDDILAALEAMHAAPEVASWSLVYTHPYGYALYAHGHDHDLVETVSARDGLSLREAGDEAIQRLRARGQGRDAS